jgi:PAS domain S-box-containing protein
MLRERRIGTLVALYELDELYARMRLYGLSVLLIVGASGFLAFLLSTPLQTMIATPISRLAQTTAAVSKTRDYRIRADKLSRDELGVLVDGFNAMLERIESRDRELREALAAREEALKDAGDARDFLKTTLASIGDAVIATGVEGAIVFANPVACSLVRWTEEEAVGRHLNDVLRLVNENTRQPIESPVTRALREGVIAAANHTILIARDGAEIPIDESAAPIRNRRGDLIGVVLIFRDITERRRAERELSAAREQLQLITDTMAPAVVHCGRDLRYIWVSPSYASLLQLTPAGIAGKPIVDIIGPETFAVVLPYIERVLAGERVEYEAEVTYPRVGRHWIHAAYVPTRNRDGAVYGWVAHVMDLTALKDAQAEVARINADLKKTNEHLARSNEDLERFAFAASHDLQEPLRMITTYAQLLIRTYPKQLEGETNAFVRNILEGAMRMRELLSDLLAYSEISGETGDPPQPVNLDAIVQKVRKNLQVAVQESGAAISPGNLPTVLGNAGHFVQLFQNLVGNAIKYRGAEPPQISISWKPAQDEIQFAVSDNGIGIDPAYHAKIFGVFKRLHGKKIPGTGIGLAICQRIVERYRGRIWVESEPGRGATFFFTLPEEIVKTGEHE